MKQNATVLAKNNWRRHVVLDVTGKIRLTWDKKRVHFSPPNFGKLVKLLEDSVFELNLTRTSEGSYLLKQKIPGTFQLRLDNTDIQLSLMDFLNLVTLVRTAVKQMPKQPLIH